MWMIRQFDWGVSTRGQGGDGFGVKGLGRGGKGFLRIGGWLVSPALHWSFLFGDASIARCDKGNHIVTICQISIDIRR